MHSEKDSPISSAGADSPDSSQEITLNWLLELDRDEPQEKLFVVDNKQAVSTKLSAFETEVAARPMMRGRAGADDFDSYVGEEIVISSEGASSDIYSSNESPDAIEDSSIEEAMALDFSRSAGEEDEFEHINIADGDDILCLEDNDDIGETYFVAKRVKRDEATSPVVEQKLAESAPVAASTVDQSVAGQSASPEPEEIVFEAVEQQRASDEPRIMGELNLNQQEPDEIVLDSLPDDVFGGAPDEVLELDLSADLSDYFTTLELSEPDQAADNYELADGQLSASSEDAPSPLADPEPGAADNTLMQGDGDPIESAGPPVEPAIVEPVAGAPHLAVVESIVFEEDIFDTDLSEVSLELESSEIPDDIGAVFDDFALQGDDGDDIFGLEIEGFPEAAIADEQTESMPLQSADVSHIDDHDILRELQELNLDYDGADEPGITQPAPIAVEKTDPVSDVAGQALQLAERSAHNTIELQGCLKSLRAQLAALEAGVLHNLNAAGGDNLEVPGVSQYSGLQDVANSLREGIDGLADLVEVASLNNTQAVALLRQQATVIPPVELPIDDVHVVPADSPVGEAESFSPPDDLVPEGVLEPGDDSFLALVVDDSRTQRMVATSQLQTVGIETATAENGAVAIDWLNNTERAPDVILLDVEMPVKDGIQTLREIRKSPRFKQTPVIMITSRTGIKHRTLAEDAGCSGYMGKPFNFRLLVGQINDLTGHRIELT